MIDDIEIKLEVLGLVNVRDNGPDIVIDLKYVSEDNFADGILLDMDRNFDSFGKESHTGIEDDLVKEGQITPLAAKKTGGCFMI